MAGRGNLGLCVILIAGFALANLEREARSQGTPPPAVTVKSVVSRAVTDTGTYIGRVVPIERVEIVARVPGFIEQRNFTEGQLVKKGELLFRIEQDTYKAAVDQQAANLAKAKANEINANLQLERNQALIKSQAVPQATIDQLAAAEQGAQGRHFTSAGLARAGPNKSCVHRGSLPDRRENWHCEIHRGKFGSTVFRANRDHREPGPDLHYVSTERG